FAPHEEVVASRRGWRSKAPVILWNHRWEYDKAPERFVDALIELDRRGAAFEVAVCGESFGKVHPAFERLEAELSPRIRHLGFIESADDYRRLVADSDIVVSTARHEYFGVSVVEAMVLGCLPVLPAKLSYPEIVPPHLHPLFLYRDESELPDFLERFLAEPPTYFADEVRAAVGRFHWRHLAPVLDDHLEAIASGAHPKRLEGRSNERERGAQPNARAARRCPLRRSLVFCRRLAAPSRLELAETLLESSNALAKLGQMLDLRVRAASDAGRKGGRA